LELNDRLAIRRKRQLRGVPSTPQDRPGVTVVVLSYNYGRFLTASASSVLDQRDVDVRLLIVDDASVDETQRVTERLAGGDERVTVIRNRTNRGQLPSMNAALAGITTEYVVKLDADDLLAPGALARATALMEQHPDVTFTYGRPHIFSGQVPSHPESPPRSWTIWDGSDWFARRCRSAVNAICQPEVVMRSAAVRQIGAVREDLPHTFDMHLFLELALSGDVGRVNGPPQGYYRIHEHSLQRTDHAGMLFDLRGRRHAFDAVFAGGAADRIPDADDLHDQARQALATAALDWACRAFDDDRSEEEPIDELVRFATETYPAANQFPAWTALQRRIAAGPEATPRLPRVVAGLRRRVADSVGYRVWQRTGER
jgi:hypothetical protein